MYDNTNIQIRIIHWSNINKENNDDSLVNAEEVTGKPIAVNMSNTVEEDNDDIDDIIRLVSR